jgi:hypothetical protein
VGVKSLCTDKAFRVLNDQTEYSMWRFTVLDLDAAAQRGAGVPGAPGQPGAGGRPGIPGQPGQPGRGPGSIGGSRPSRLNSPD